jgi:hypothetical protein
MAKLKKTVSLTGGLAAFKSTHDPKVVVPNKIRAALANMSKANPESWLPEDEFIDQAGVSKEEMRTNREAFDEHIVEVKRKGRGTPARFWFADVKVAAKARS